MSDKILLRVKEERIGVIKVHEGLPGKTAYQVAVDNGFSGTASDWLGTLAGKSAYELAVDDGFTGTQAEWLNSISINASALISAETIGLGNVDNTSDSAKPISNATQTALSTKAPLHNPNFTGTVTGVTKVMVGLGNVDDTSDLAKPVSLATQTALSTKAPLHNPNFTGTVTGVSKVMVGLGNVDDTSDLAKPISTATQTALNTKAPINNPTFTGTVTGVSKAMVGLGNVDNNPTSLDYKLASQNHNASSSAVFDLRMSDYQLINSTLGDKVISGSEFDGFDDLDLSLGKIFDGSATSLDFDLVGQLTILLGDVVAQESTILIDDLPVSSQLEPSDFTIPTSKLVFNKFSDVYDLLTGKMSNDAFSNVDNTSDLDKPISIATQTELNLKAPLTNPTFTGTVTGVSKAMVGLSEVDNTSDLAKPVSTATETALNLKAPLDSPTFTGTVTGVSKAMVGLGNVDNTSDLNKPVSVATQEILNQKAPINNPTFTGTVTGVSKAMVGLSNVDNTSDLNKPISTATQTALNTKAPLASPVFTGNVSGITKAMVGLSNVDNTSDLNKPVSAATATLINETNNTVRLTSYDFANVVLGDKTVSDPTVFSYYDDVDILFGKAYFDDATVDELAIISQLDITLGKTIVQEKSQTEIMLDSLSQQYQQLNTELAQLISVVPDVGIDDISGLTQAISDINSVISSMQTSIVGVTETIEQLSNPMYLDSLLGGYFMELS